MKVVTGDDGDIECDSVEEGTRGVFLYDDDRGQVGYVPFENLRYAAYTRTPVSSSVIESVGYDPDEDRLELAFHSGGVYRYADVPQRVYQDLLSAPSHGRYFHDEIRGEFEYTRVR